MGDRVDTVSGGTFAARRDATWEREVRTEIVRMIAEREKNGLAANLFGWGVCLTAALALPYSKVLIPLLLLRLVAITSTRLACNGLRRKLANREPVEKTVRLVGCCTAFAGITWGLLLWPIIMTPLEHTPAFAIIGVATVSVSLIANMLGPRPRVLFGFVAAFAATVMLGLALTPMPVTGWITLSLLGMIGGIIAFSLGSAREHVAMAEMLVENKLLGEELATALAHAEFLSGRDPLTGMMNRRAFFEDSNHAAPARRMRHVLVIDLDHFKQINDRFGHSLGDKVLIATADSMRRLLRDLPEGPHYAVRMGGEEFVLLLGGLEHAAAHSLAEVLRRRIAEVTEEMDVPELAVSASIGLAACEPGKALADALHRADLAMYRAKNAGRNRVVLEAA